MLAGRPRQAEYANAAGRRPGVGPVSSETGRIRRVRRLMTCPGLRWATVLIKRKILAGIVSMCAVRKAAAMIRSASCNIQAGQLQADRRASAATPRQPVSGCRSATATLRVVP
ncbi:MAG: hypothetical protein VR78_03850 [Hoeflea sp. BRH_c9]|nr:MAG: hypothetical protein VR78_03850 [Hoeflea sp. BRH_c9]